MLLIGHKLVDIEISVHGPLRDKSMHTTYKTFILCRQNKCYGCESYFTTVYLNNKNPELRQVYVHV